MGCNCGDGSARQSVTVYQLNLPDGTIRQYVTPQEALAAQQRAGGVGTVTIVTQP
ncbi:DUF7196 family protein [Streptomyces sp. NPDC002587]